MERLDQIGRIDGFVTTWSARNQDWPPIVCAESNSPTIYFSCSRSISKLSQRETMIQNFCIYILVASSISSG